MMTCFTDFQKRDSETDTMFIWATGDAGKKFPLYEIGPITALENSRMQPKQRSAAPIR